MQAAFRFGVAVVTASFVGFVAAKDEFTWGGRAAHPAVVNPVLGEDAANVLSLRGSWECTKTFRNVPMRVRALWGFFPTAEWKDVRTIEVPSCWEAQGVGEEGKSECWEPTWDENSKPIRHKHMGALWYRKRVTLPAAWAGKRIFLKFGGVKSAGWVWVNGKQVALVHNYCGTYKYEVTDLVEPGKEATVVVQVDNRYPSRKGLMSAMHRFGGIYRDVEFEATPGTYIDDAWVRGDFDRRSAEVKVVVAGDAFEAKGQGRDAKGDLLLRATIEGETKEIPLPATANLQHPTFTLNLPLRAFRPWSPEHPNLYTATVEIVRGGQVLQTRRERFGVRKLEVVGREFRLNGKPFFFRGFGDDHVYPLTGLSPADRAVHRAHLAKARAAGFNAVRLHTHCELPEYFEVADELGILIQAELPYYSDVPTENFEFDPKRDATELYEHYRRHPSFAVYSLGNEGSFGDALDRKLHAYIKAMDPDRLKINQDTSLTAPWLYASDRADYDSGPIKSFPRGSITNARPVFCHEYMNLGVKTDSRTEKLYTGVWMPPVTRADRGKWLAQFGLAHENWGDRLQDAQHALQGIWQKEGIECARSEVGVGGYHYWTIVDVVVWNDAVRTYSGQGLFNPFWQEKSGGLTAADFARFNSPMCVLADFAPSNAVLTVGEKLKSSVNFAHFGDAPIADGVLDWSLVASDGTTLAAGSRAVGAVALGPVRPLAEIELTVPAVAKPVRVEFVANVRARDGSVAQSNAWPLWIFPKGPTHREILDAAAKRGVTIAAKDSPAAKAALAVGRPLITLDGTNGKPNCKLGWWWMGNQVGTAIRRHPALGDFPTDETLTQVWFRLIKDKGLKLPATDISPDEMVIVGEGGTACYLYLAVRQIGASRVIACHGLDLVTDTPEGNALLRNLVGFLDPKVNK